MSWRGRRQARRRLAVEEPRVRRARRNAYIYVANAYIYVYVSMYTYMQVYICRSGYVYVYIGMYMYTDPGVD